MKVFNWKLNILKNKLLRDLNIQFKNKDILIFIFFLMSRVYMQFCIYSVVNLLLQLYVTEIQDSRSKWFMELNFIDLF